MNTLHTTSGVTHHYCQWRQATCIYATAHNECAITSCIGPVSGLSYSYVTDREKEKDKKTNKAQGDELK